MMETGLTYTSTVVVSKENVAAECVCHSRYGGVDGECCHECRGR